MAAGNVNTVDSTWSIAKPCDEAVRWLQARLLQMGLRALRTFDLHDARLGAADCPCPHHGTDNCDCQMVVLLVYEAEVAPVTLVLHGNAHDSWISVIDRPEQRAAPATVAAVQRALVVEDIPTE